MEIIEAQTADEIEAARELMREYGAFLGAHPPAMLCAEGYEAEIARLPDLYAVSASGGPGVLLLAREGERTVGCVGLRALHGMTAHGFGIAAGERACEMKRLWVRAEGRGKGAGRLLVNAAVRWAEAQDYTTLALDTLPAAMPEAYRLYRTLDFEEIPALSPAGVPDGTLAFFRLRLRPASSSLKLT